MELIKCMYIKINKPVFTEVLANIGTWHTVLTHYILFHSTSACLVVQQKIEHVNEYPTMHHSGIPRNTQSMIANKTLTEYYWKFQ